MASGSRWLKRALAELPPVGLLPPEYVGAPKFPSSCTRRSFSEA